MPFGPVLWIEGPIGAGKTTLTTAICKGLELRGLFEPVDTNVYLKDFYKDPKRWAFPMQIELLKSRYAMQKIAAFEASHVGGFKGSVLDRGLPGDRVFCRLHVEYGNISEREWHTYDDLFSVMMCSLTPPSLLVYLDVDPEVSLERVKTRARDAEVGVDIEYLTRLRRGYLDLLVEIESGTHHWSRGMEVMRVPWNVDHQSPDGIIDMIQHRFRL